MPGGLIAGPKVDIGVQLPPVLLPEKRCMNSMGNSELPPCGVAGLPMPLLSTNCVPATPGSTDCTYSTYHPGAQENCP